MHPTLTHLAAVAALLIAAASSATDQQAPSSSPAGAVAPMPAEWVPAALADVHAAAAQSGFFRVVHKNARTWVQLLEGGPVLKAFSRRTGDRGVLRPHALSSSRAETDKFLGVALFAGRQRFTSTGGASVYGLEGGAAIRLLKQIDFTARYRMLSYDGRDLLSELRPEVSAPLFGFALKF